MLAARMLFDRAPLNILYVGHEGHAIDQRRLLPPQIHPVVVCTAEQRAADDISDQSRDDAFPDVKNDRDVRVADPDSHGDEEHVGDLRG